MQMENNALMRYHSAPSSVLASLNLDEDCTSEQPPVSDAFLQVEESEFGRFLDEHICNYMDPQSGLKPSPSQGFLSMPVSTSASEAASFIADSEMHPQLLTEHHESSALLQQPACMATTRCGSSIKEIFGFRGPLSSMSEVLADESNQVCRQVNDAETVKISTAASHWPNPLKTPVVNREGELANVKLGQLARHKSSPADGLSRLITGEGNAGQESQVLHFNGGPSPIQESWSKGGSMLNQVCARFASLPAERISILDGANQASQITDKGKGLAFVEAKSVLTSPADKTHPTLIRQNNSPADLNLSQIYFGGVQSSILTCRETASSSFFRSYATDEGRRGGAYQPARCWGEIEFDKAGLEDRKRGRDDHVGDMAHRLQSSEVSFENQTYPDVSGSQAKMPGSTGLFNMEVLCRVSAKRGCATHPRSIAERVRRTKINEGIRKLQELMPNVEKQTSTITMLDEAVEYVKFLQQQVQELSKSRSKCDGRCKASA